MSFIFRLVGIFLLVLCWLAVPTARAHSNTLQIAIAAPFIGELHEYGDLIWQGASAAVEQVNQSGGILGLPLELVKINQSCDSKTTINLTNTLVNQQAIVAVLAHSCRENSITSFNNYLKAGKLLLTPASTPYSLLRGGHNTFFSFTPLNYTTEAKLIRLQSQAAVEAIVQALLHSKTYSGDVLARWLRYNQVHTSMGKISWDTNGALYGN